MVVRVCCFVRLVGAGVVALLLAACGGSGASPPAPDPPSQPGAPPLVSGSESALASAVLSTRSDAPLATQDVSNGFVLSRLLVSLKTSATVSQLNAAARVVGATRISSSESGSLLVVLEVPRQANVAAIQSLAKTMRAQPGIAFAWSGQTAAPAVLPELTPGTPVSTVGLEHLLGNRFPQAWNARQTIAPDCLPRSVGVYVIDFFGPASARPNFFNEIDRSSFIQDPNGMSSVVDGHGYDVVSTLAANFDSDTPTGADPFRDCLLVHAVEVQHGEYLDSLRRALRMMGADGDPRIIATSSLNYRHNGFCGLNGDQICDATTTPATVPEFVHEQLFNDALIAAEWARLVRAHGLLEKMLMTQSAGNVHDELPAGFLEQNFRGFRDARLSSVAALATHLHELKSLLTSRSLWKSETTPTLPDFTMSDADVDAQLAVEPSLDADNSLDASNLLIVDSGTAAPARADIAMSAFDFLGADVRAVGEGVPLFNQVQNGTSFSTPLVAGLAAYLWNLSSALEGKPASATADLIRRTSSTTASSPTVPVVDAYAAVLQLDDVAGCCAGSRPTPVRLGLVDVDGDGGFTGLDLQRFAQAFGLANPNTPTIPATRDFSRFDLNGDGFTGGVITTAFDLDVNGLETNGQAKINVANESVEGVQIAFNEAAVSDLQILCYYAYSPLYASDNGGQNDQVRTNLLGPDHCIGARLDVQLPARISAATPMNVNVQVPDAQGQLAPARDLLVQITPTCATVTPSSGRTDANGNLAAVVTPTAGCTSASLQSVARANATTPPLAQQVTSVAITGPRNTTYASVGIGQNAPGGALRATFSDLGPGGTLVTAVDFTMPVSDLASFMSRVSDELSGVTELGFLDVRFADAISASTTLDLSGIPVGELSVVPGCGMSLVVNVGKVRTNPDVDPFTRGVVTVAGCGIATVTTGDATALVINGQQLNATVIAPVFTGGIDIGRGTGGLVSSTLDIRSGSTRQAVISGTSDSTISIQAIVDGDLFVSDNRQLTIGSDLSANGLSGFLAIQNNSFVGPALTRFSIGNIGRDLTITDNVGFTDTEARDFASARTVSGTTTISNNRAQ